MEKKDLQSLVVKKGKNKDTWISIRVAPATVKALQAKNIDINKTVRAMLERLAE